MNSQLKNCSTAILIITAIALVMPLPAVADSAYVELPKDNLCDLETGWAWDCQPKIIKEKKKKKKKPDKQIVIVAPPSQQEKPEDPNDPLVWLDNYQKGEKRARAKMLMEPTQENVMAYRKKYFQDTMDRATLTSDHWRRIAWQNPDQDYTLKRPTGSLAKRDHDLRRNKKIDETLASLGDRYGVFFMFESHCAACLKFAPILESFAQKHDLHVQGVSRDGKPLRTWSGAWRPDENGALYRMGLENKPSPAIALFDKKEKRTIPIGYGIMAHDQLANRIYVLTQVKAGEDY